MFAGIVQGTGRVVEIVDRAGDVRVSIDFASSGLAQPTLGASVAVNGVCLTAVAAGGDRFAADVSRETLSVTTLGALEAGVRVNLESSLRLGDPIDGHLVSGHVDGVGHVVAIEPAARSQRIVVDLPDALARFVARKGSIALDGVSLTVNDISGACCDVNVVPHTQAVTVIGEYAAGRAVNVEVDMLARYVARLLDTGEARK